MDNQNTVISNGGGGVRAGQYITDGSCTWLITDTRDGTPVGRVVADVCVRDGYVKANGATVLRADYPRLVNFADQYNLWIEEADKTAYPGMFGAGDRETTMSLPDWRGVVGRYLDDGRGLDDVNRILGTYQEDAMRNFTGSFGVTVNGSRTGLFRTKFTQYHNPTGGTKGWFEATVYFEPSSVVPTAAENRMKNIAVLAVIRY